MEGFVAHKLNEFETGKISRRKLIDSLTLAATTLFAADSAQAQADTTLKAQLINHISYTCPNFRQGAEWETASPRELVNDELQNYAHPAAE